MKLKLICAVGTIGVAMLAPAHAVHHQFSDVVIGNLRAVGDYNGTTFDNTLEIHPAAPLTIPAGLLCTATHRVFIDSRHKHLIANVQLALATGRKINIGIDDALPLRNGACEVTYIDVAASN